jgi:hypothetical protein
VLLEMIAENLDIPLPSVTQANEQTISVSPEVAVPVMLHLSQRRIKKF